MAEMGGGPSFSSLFDGIFLFQFEMGESAIANRVVSLLVGDEKREGKSESVHKPPL